MKAKKLSRIVAILVTRQLELWLSLHTSLVEKKPSLFLLSIKSSSWSQEGSGGQKMMPELLNETFSVKATRLNLENTKSNPMKPQTHAQNDYCIPTAHVLRVNDRYVATWWFKDEKANLNLFYSLMTTLLSIVYTIIIMVSYKIFWWGGGGGGNE